MNAAAGVIFGPPPVRASTSRRAPAAEGRRRAGAPASWSTARGGSGFPTPSGKLEFYSSTLRRLGLAGAGGPDLQPSNQVPASTDGRGPTTFALLPDVPPADARPHAHRQREVAERDLPLQPGLDPSRGRGTARRRDRRPRACRDRDRPLRQPGLGHRGDPPRRRGAARITWAAGGSARTRGTRPLGQRRVVGPRATEASRAGWTWHAPRSKAWRRSRSTTPTRARIWWRDAGVHQNLTFPVHPDPISGQHAGTRR